MSLVIASLDRLFAYSFPGMDVLPNLFAIAAFVFKSKDYVIIL